VVSLRGRDAGGEHSEAFLALPDSDDITGQLLAMDGGYLAQELSS
jgi:hypothetical protein